MKIELLYFDGCPSWHSGLQNLYSALKANGLDVSVELVQVMDNDDVARNKFLGSPSFRINGVDLWDEQRDMYSLSCRVYATPEGMKGSPTVSMLSEALHRFMDKAYLYISRMKRKKENSMWAIFRKISFLMSRSLTITCGTHATTNLLCFITIN